MRAAWRPPPRNSSSRPKSHHRTLLVAHLQGVSKPLLRYLPSAAESTSPAWKALVAENCAHHSLIPDVARAPHRERLLACPSARSLSAQLGHGGDALVRKMYGHLGVTRVWSDVVEYRV